MKNCTEKQALPGRWAEIKQTEWFQSHPVRLVWESRVESRTFSNLKKLTANGIVPKFIRNLISIDLRALSYGAMSVINSPLVNEDAATVTF